MTTALLVHCSPLPCLRENAELVADFCSERSWATVHPHCNRPLVANRSWNCSFMMRALSVGLFFVSLVRYSLGAGNVTCASNALDWYTDVVGETPCTSVALTCLPSTDLDLSSGMTYQRLRQICNSKCMCPLAHHTQKSKRYIVCHR